MGRWSEGAGPMSQTQGEVGRDGGREGGGEEVIECGVGEKRGFDRQGWVNGICHGHKERCIVHVWVWGGLLGR